MTVTNNERREVAKMLRELPTNMYEVEELWEMKGLDTCCKDQTDYYLIHFALFGCFPADHIHPCDYEELHARLADLIEPEPERTCRNLSKNGGFHCDGCGLRIDYCTDDCSCGFFAYDICFCPNCGAKVVVE